MRAMNINPKQLITKIISSSEFSFEQCPFSMHEILAWVVAKYANPNNAKIMAVSAMKT